MSVISMNFLLESGVHFGHQTKRWNPKMNEYIFTARDDIYIIDLQKTVKKIEEAYEALNAIAANGGKVLFVGTKKQAQEAVKEEATRSEMYYVNERWLGGTLTNFRTIRKRIYRMEDIEKMEKDGVFELLPKKEVIQIRKEYDKLVKYLNGIRDMKKIPEAMIIVDPRKEMSAIKEARRLKIPVFGIVDTNCDPDDVDYVIPGNDDAVRAVKVILGVLTNALNAANGGNIIDYINEEDKKKDANIAKNIARKAEILEKENNIEEKVVEIKEEKVIVEKEVKIKEEPKKEEEVKIKEEPKKEEEVKLKKVVAKKETEEKEEVKPKKAAVKKVVKEDKEEKPKKAAVKKVVKEDKEEKPKTVKKATAKKVEPKVVKKPTVKKPTKKVEKK